MKLTLVAVVALYAVGHYVVRGYIPRNVLFAVAGVLAIAIL